MKISKRMIPIFILIISVSMSAALFVYEMTSRQDRSAQIQYSVISSSVYEAISNEITKPIYTSLTIANDILLKDLLQKEEFYSETEAVNIISNYLESVKKSIGADTAFLISDQTRKYYSEDGLYKIIDVENDEHDVWYPYFVNTRKPYDVDVDVDQLNGNSWTVFVNARIEDENGNFLGVCGLGLSMERLQELLKDYENKYHIKINFIDSNGLVQVDTNMINIENAYLYDVQYGKEKDGYSYKNREGEYVVMRYVENLNWYLVIHGRDNTIQVQDIVRIVLVSLLVIIVNITGYFVCTKVQKNL